MKNLSLIGTVAALVFQSVSSPAYAAKPSNTVMSEGVKAAVNGREMHIIVAQSEIKPDFVRSEVSDLLMNDSTNSAMDDMAGALVGYLIDSSANKKRAAAAEAAIVPLRAALKGFDVDAIALEATKQSVKDLDWLSSLSVTVGKDVTPAAKSELLDKSPVGQIAFVEYSYDLSPRFDAIRVKVSYGFADKVAPKGSTAKGTSRLSPKNLAYRSSIISIVTLADAVGGTVDSSASKWSADNGKLAQAAIRTAFAQVAALTPRILALSAAEVKAMSAKDKPKRIVSGHQGQVQSEDKDSTLLWGSEGFIHMQYLH